MEIKKSHKNRSLFKKVYARIKKRNYFLITSSGQMGTFWLASQLNKHPDIFCSHSYDRPAWGAEGAPLRGEEGERQRYIIKEFLAKMPLKKFFAENARVSFKSYVGNVHAYKIDRALELREKEKLFNVKIVNLIRHPITRINSLVNCIHNEWYDYGYVDHLAFVPKLYIDQGRKVIQDCLPRMVDEFDDSLQKQFFIVSALLEKRTALELAIAEKHAIPSFRYEDITSSKEILTQLVKEVSDETLIKNYDWISNDVTYKKLNSHSQSAYQSTQAIFDGWEPWKKEIYRYIASDNIFNVYKQDYYNFTIE